MRILFKRIESAPNVQSDQYVDIPGLSFTLPKADDPHKLQSAIVILNVPRPFAEGNNNPGLDFSINADGFSIADGGFTYEMAQPQFFGRVPITLVVAMALNRDRKTLVRAQWRSVRGSIGHIDSYASMTASIDYLPGG